MPHATFGYAPTADDIAIEPITFEIGPIGETFTVVPTPTLGDVLDLADAPEPDPSNEPESILALARFIRRMVDPSDRARYDAALYRIHGDARCAPILIGIAEYIAQQATGFPSRPSSSSSAGRRTTDASSKRKPAGRRASRR